MDRCSLPASVDVVASALGYTPPIDGLLGSGLSKMLAYQRASEVLKALGLPLDVPAETVRRWGAGAVIHLAQRTVPEPGTSPPGETSR